MTSEPKSAAGDPPKWAMEAAGRLREEGLIALSALADSRYPVTLKIAHILDAAAPSEAEIRRDEMERCCRDICGGCYRREHQFIGASTQSIHHCAAWDIRKRFSNDLHGGQKT